MDAKKLIEMKERQARLLRAERDAAGISQAKMASSMGMSRSTYQQREDAIALMGLDELMDFHAIVDRPVLPYLWQIMQPDHTYDLTPNGDDEQVADALAFAVQTLPIHYKRLLLFVLYGDHGGDPLSSIDMLAAHLQTSLYQRLMSSEVITNGYKLSKNLGTIKLPDHEQPDIDSLERTNATARDAILEGISAYHSKKAGGERR